MAMVSTNGNGTTLLRAVKPFKTGWKVEIKALHSWTHHSSYGGGDTLEFILADATGDKIHCTCKRVFTPRAKKHMQIGQWIQQRQWQQLRASIMAEKVEESLCLKMKL
ncbi:hypothetical protein Bca4012_078585 [Brassica carinata]|uniref:Replication protein A 70 kDa DNA-binding subunit B/D first OB fold domain-containing protein n=1 Tax=Brassica carinata TaxID=52824 RepID=A0A8X7NZ33_BRACI|nr:hypothetical protein Bca52824_096047 [Brassica carinata]KAG2264307.1 hypothetical protein Bca52824_071386 [Brassica carinata]